jgi:DNA-binding CsgD family transcriptional regulator/sugar-specific transcriptional regulator TrmB
LVLAALGLSATAEQVYRAMLAEPDWSVADLGRSLGVDESAVRTALDELFEMALVRDSADGDGRLHVVSPDVGLRLALGRQQTELARRQQEVAASQAAIEQLIEQFSPEQTIVQLRGMDAVRDRLAGLAQETKSEVLTLMPGGAQSATSLDQARRDGARLIQRGVQIRTVGLDSIRNDPATLKYAQFLTDNGAEFRTSPVLPPRMILVDRRAALVPINPAATRDGALYLTGPGVLASMLALFEQIWEISTPLGVDAHPDRQGLLPNERTLLQLLARGMTDEAAATRLNISHRTARRLMAALMERLGARSRFEAGLKAVQRGWL